MVQAPTKPISLETFLAQPETKPASEFINGSIHQKPMPQGQHSLLQGSLTSGINKETQPTRTALALPELRCTFGGQSIVPDIAVFTWDRIPTTPDGDIVNTFSAHPDWAIEILSSNQSATLVTSKLLHCLKHGTQMGWLLDPSNQLVLVYPNNGVAICCDQSDMVLPVPDFAKAVQLSVGDLFSWLKIR